MNIDVELALLCTNLAPAAKEFWLEVGRGMLKRQPDQDDLPVGVSRLFPRRVLHSVQNGVSSGVESAAPDLVGNSIRR